MLYGVFRTAFRIGCRYCVHYGFPCRPSVVNIHSPAIGKTRWQKYAVWENIHGSDLDPSGGR
jgi:hypothetical protein